MFDAIRSQFPNLGFALYALEPQGLVTLEVIDEQGNVFSFKGVTAERVMATAFPPLPPPPQEPEAQEPATSIFD